MKKLLLLLLGLNLINCYSQRRITFNYDAAGNQEKRLVCLCAAKTANDSIYKDLEELTENDLVKEDEQVSYYPNPVLEELYVKWSNTENSRLVAIDLYTLNGQLLKHYTNLKNQETAKVAFYNLPDGYYNVVLLYSNDERKTLKIVKQK
ncbi:T9SS type A sorting domain-containing protein [Flavobacterium amniphilum]|uniref:T9SS type A sorting domain-containing protein n=1 Tax=Flavobacterium amniphilum TaxID=1834035 RepID=UPI00202A504D|nr:T9SS type A sorting domain-containing protein [Flavobacterium amniphilum]MCL9806450.1 T9SS type A sorting domain-containing protein [Flavobacterium amniphilum]